MPFCLDGDASSQQSGAGPRFKSLVIFLLCTMGLCYSMMVDCPMALKDDLIAEMKITPNQFDLQYHLLFWPNIFCWLAGLLVDRFLDVTVASVIFVVAVMLGNTLYAIGAVTQVYQVMLFGRIITGIGIEASYIFISCYVLRWFPKKITNTVFALTKSLPLLGYTLVINVSDMVMAKASRSMLKRQSLSIAIATVMAVVVIPLVISIILSLMSKWRRTRGNVTSEQQTIKIKDVIHFPARFWFLSISVNLFFSSCLIFLKVNVLSSKYGLNVKQIDVLVNTFSVGAALMSPILGLTVDWKGRNLTGITIATIGGLIAHFSFAFFITDPFYPMILLSFSYSMMVGSYWSLYRFLFESHTVHTALAIDHSFLMLFCAVANTLAPIFVKNLANAVEIVYLTFTLIAVVGCGVLWGLECRMRSLNKNIAKNRTIRQNKGVTFRPEKRQRKNPDHEKRRIERMNMDSQKRISRPQIRGYEVTYLRLKRIEAEKNSERNKRNRENERRNRKSMEKLEEIL